MSEKNYKFQKLTPINNADLKIYNVALNYVFENDDIRNVALSGPYCSGKSSILNTYKSKHTGIRYIHISLAHFGLIKQDSNDSANSELTRSDSSNPIKYSEAVLEGKIINQLIHQVDPEKIPQTIFKVKQKVSIGKTIISTVFITLFLTLVAYMVFFRDWCNYVSELTAEWLKNMLMWTTSSDMLLLSGLLCTGIFGITIYSIITMQKNKRIFKKLKIQGNEIEIFENCNDLCFDKYLNEVLYLFENCGADVIVFEDLDRHDNNQIFKRLREINTLINNKRAISYKKNKEKKSPIRFFYLLRDDIFDSKDRTKFFDFIIPIVPVIDGSNSYDQLIALFRQGGILELFDDGFLKDLSLYIDDMRILKNIYNEFIIYRNQLDIINLNYNRLLAIIAYKNIFPKDFSDLQIGQGFVHTLFESKNKFIEHEIKNIDIQIKEIEEKIQLTNDEMLNSIDELDAIYLLCNYQIARIAKENVSNSNYETRVQLIKAMKENPDAVYYSNYGSYNHFNVTSELEELSQNPEYIKRKEDIERKFDNKIENLKIELESLKKKKVIIQNGRLQEIITPGNIDEIFSITHINEIGEKNKFEEIKANPYFPLIKYLLRNGYIDESYSDYITYFYGNSLNRIDKNFLLSVTDQIPKDYSYSLKNEKLVLSRLQITDFDHVAILNFDLLRYLLKTRPNNDEYLTSFLQQLVRTKNFDFIGRFLEERKEISLFVEAINNIWPSIFKSILAESGFSNAQIKQYAVYTLYYSPNNDIKALNEDGCLSSYISSSPDFLDINNPQIKKLIDGFSLIGVSFEWIDYNVSNKELFMAVYKNNLYKLTFNFICLILEVVYGLKKNNDFNNKNYTLISSKPDEPLAQYINKNIDEYITIMLDNCFERITDEEPVVLEIINNPEIDIDNKTRYITLLQTEIEQIETVDDKELWSLLLEEKLVKYSESNILSYFFLSKNGLDSFLVRFINDFDYKLKFDSDSIDSDFGENAASNFFKAIITCNELNNERYESILYSLNMYYPSFSITGIEEDKIHILIKLKIIQMSEDSLIFMRAHYPNQLMPFITRNIKQYTEEVINQENFDLNEMVSLLEEKINDKYKVRLLGFTSEGISLKQKGYSDAVKLHILNHNLDADDIPFLLECYPKESIDVKTAIKSIAIEYITDILEAQYSIPFELHLELLRSDQLEIETKKELFALCLPERAVSSSLTRTAPATTV
jgi:hypothetical protein